MRHSVQCVERRAGAIAAPLIWLLLLGGMVGMSSVRASCLSSEDPEMRALDALVDRDPTKALKEAQTRLDSLASDPKINAGRMAAILSAQAAAYSALELDAQARDAALKGLKLAPNLNDPVHLELLTWYSVSFYDQVGIERVIGQIEATRASQQRGSVADLCLLITLGRLQYQENRPDLAVVSLTQAYRASMKPDLAAQRVQAASALSPLMRSAGDYEQALALNQEVIDWDATHESEFDLSVARYMRGKIFGAEHNFSAAVREFEQARAVSAAVDDDQGIAFSDMSSCEAQIELGQPGGARALCANAERIFTAAESTQVQKQTWALLARIDLAEGHADRALERLNRVLDHGGADLISRLVASVYELRAHARAALRDYSGAYSDLAEFARRYVADNDAERTRQAAAQRARFDTDRQIELNSDLQHELALATERSDRQREELRWTALILAAGGLVIALLIYIIFANLRHRQALVRLASEDSLTGLPNRRLTAELASSALRSATVTQQPLTLALIDLDHFKSINDRCGHAVGDHVLREFARVTRAALRVSDIMGRWGGEEFLLVLPGTTIDVAVEVIDKLRILTLEIELPAAGDGLSVSFSAGLAARIESTHHLDELIAGADAALYEAKNEGRDLLRIAKESYLTASTDVRRAVRLRR